MTIPFSFDLQTDYGGDIGHIPAMSRIPSSDVGDLSATGGDLEAISGPGVVVRNRAKELLSPYGSMARYIRDYTGLKYIDGLYGNPAHFYLSEVSMQIPLERLAVLCEKIMLKDPRVATATAFPDVIPDSGLILIRVDYTLTAGGVGTLAVNLNTEGLVR